MRDRRSGFLQFRNLPALQWRRAFNPPLINLQGGAVRIKTFDGGAEAILKIEPAHLTVADHVQAGVFLQTHRVPHRIVFQLTQIIGSDLAVVETRARVLQRCRPQEAADDVGPYRLEVVHFVSTLRKILRYSASKAQSDASSRYCETSLDRSSASREPKL